MDTSELSKMSKDRAGYTIGTGKGFGCQRCAANKNGNGRCVYMRYNDNRIKPDGGCCNLWTTSTKDTIHWFGRLNKHQMGYIETTPGHKVTCKECKYWQNGKCKIVSGSIAPTASCNLWIAKGNPTKQY